MSIVEYSVSEISDRLRTQKVSPSLQRIQILKYLIENKNHPTVDMIYQKLVKEIPTLSKTTVYNTLNLFVERNLAIPIIIEENETRYDADISVHGHFKCNECQTVYDFDVDIHEFNKKLEKTFQILEKHIYYKGICKDCIEKIK